MKPLLLITVLILATVSGNCRPVRVQELSNLSAQTILDAAVAHFRTAEPSWSYVSGICTCPPLMDEQQRVVVGTWRSDERGHVREIADVAVYQISTADAASRWIANYGEGHVAEGWSVARYNLGLTSFLATFRDHTRYTITFAKAQFLVTVSGASTRDIDQVARCLLQQIDNKQLANFLGTPNKSWLKFTRPHETARHASR